MHDRQIKYEFAAGAEFRIDGQRRVVLTVSLQKNDVRPVGVLIATCVMTAK